MMPSQPPAKNTGSESPPPGRLRALLLSNAFLSRWCKAALLGLLCFFIISELIGRRILLPREIFTRGQEAIHVVNWLGAGASLFLALLAGFQASGHARLHHLYREMARELDRRHEAESALRESETRFRNLVESTRDWFWEFDTEGRCLYTSPQISRILGRDPASLPGREIFSLMPPGEALRQRDRYRRAASLREHVLSFQGTFLHEQGLAVRIETDASPVYDADGLLTGFRAVNRDISRRAAAEARAGDLRRQLDAVLSAAPLPIFALDQDQHLYLYNPAFAELFQINNYGKLQMDSLPLLPAELARFLQHIRTLPSGDNAPPSSEITLPLGCGSIRICLLTRARLCDSQGQATGLVGTLTDITALKEAEKELRLLERQAQEAQKYESLGLMAGGVAHDFNNLLAGILGNLDLLSHELPQHHPGNEYVDAALLASQRAVDLCRQMLAYSGRGHFHFEPVDVNEAAREMCHLLRSSISNKIKISLDLAATLPHAEADPTQIRQILLNLITNAAEAIGGRPGTIHLATRSEHGSAGHWKSIAPRFHLDSGTCVVLEVADTGCGIDPEATPRIFDPFFTTKFTGRGLGLAAVMGIVKGHGGAILADSSPGRGATFRIYLPASHAPAAIVPNATTPAPDWTGVGTVLLVDDEPAVRQVGKAMLTRLGLTAHTAEDGVQALEFVRQRQGDLRCVVLDLLMPGMDGRETCRELRRLYPRLPIILSSGYAETEVRQRFGQEGFTNFVQKPYQLRQLAACLRNTLGGNDDPVLPLQD